MTETNLNLVLTNALCCSSKLAVEVADLYAMNNKCADSEFAKLKLLIDRIEALKCYNFTVNKNSEFSFTLNSGLNFIFNSLGSTFYDGTITLVVNDIIYNVPIVPTDTCKQMIINQLIDLQVLKEYYEKGELTKVFVLDCSVINFTFQVIFTE
jgi:hypothetical protein